jgi:hypothetical protein
MYIFEKLIWSGRCETPAGSVGQVRLLKAQSVRRLTARPVESEYLERRSTTFKGNKEKGRILKKVTPLSFKNGVIRVEQLGREPA